MNARKRHIRPTADTARGRNRRPLETLEFFGLRDDMKVVELLPGGHADFALFSSQPG